MEFHFTIHYSVISPEPQYTETSLSNTTHQTQSQDSDTPLQNLIS